MLECTGERYLPWLEATTTGYEHLHRYAYATQFVKDKTVLDLASGEGYGSYLLAGTASSVVGIDIDRDAVRHASNKYIRENLQFRLGSILEIPVEGRHLFDVIVCFEALEHVEDHHQLLKEVKRLLLPNGLFIVSTPNKWAYTDEPKYKNPFHVHELYFDEFRSLLESYFKKVKLFGQRIYYNSNIWPIFGEKLDLVEYVMERRPQGFVFVEKEKKVPIYFVAIASDAAENIEEKSSNLIDISNELQQKEKQLELLMGEKERLVQDVARVRQELAERQREGGQLQEEIARLQDEGGQLQREVAQKAEQVTQLSTERKQLAERSAQLQATLERQRHELNRIYTSLAWKTVEKYRRLKVQLFPARTRRRDLYDRVLMALKGRSSRKGDSSSESNLKQAGEKLGSREEAFEAGLIPAEPVVRRVGCLIEEDIPKEEATISVVIPTKNAGEDFRRVLAAISRQKGFRDMEIIVVDSGSTDKTVQFAEQAGAKLIKILPEEFSHSYARNLGASYASGDYLLFTVQDALPPSDFWLYELLSVIKKNEVVAVSCAEFPSENADLFYRAISWNHYRFLEVDKEDRIMSQMGAEDHWSLRKNGQLSDLACLISKDVFAKYEYKTDYGEDLDLGLRLIRDGHRIAFLSSTRIIHSHNRPPYYYLKRGYVENLFIPRIFPDYPVLGCDLDRLLPDIVFTHQVTRSMVEEGALRLQFPCKTTDFASNVIERFQAALKKTYPVPEQVVGSPLLDTEFRDFLSRIIREHWPEGSKVRPCGGNLGQAVLGSTRMVLSYMQDTYEVVDGHVAEEFKSTLYKTFAYQCGAQLAHCFLGCDGAGQQELEQIHVELSKGV